MGKPASANAVRRELAARRIDHLDGTSQRVCEAADKWKASLKAHARWPCFLVSDRFTTLEAAGRIVVGDTTGTDGTVHLYVDPDVVSGDMAMEAGSFWSSKNGICVLGLGEGDPVWCLHCGLPATIGDEADVDACCVPPP